jgi:hypothetical protein
MTDTLRLAGIFIRFRLRSMRNAFRARRRGRAVLIATIVGVVTAVAYVGLFAQAFSIIARTVDLAGQVAVLALVTGTIAFGSLAARAAGNEAVRAGSPENEFLLARPVSLPRVVAARGIADAVTDPVGGLFLLPVLISATFVWGLGLTAWPVAIAISVLVQVGISTLAYGVQLAVVRYVPAPRRRLAWTGLRLVAALSLATLWMLGTWVMRAPAALAGQVAGFAPALAFSPSALVSAPLAALVRHQPGHAAVAIGALGGVVAAAMLLTVAVARRAGMAGWEEAGAVWAETSPAPGATARLPTAATKDLRLIVRDRSQLLALIAIPFIFIGVQIFGAVGWDWTTASLQRVSRFAYSVAVYMCTIGPLTHMQAERRAFWILRTVPVPLAKLLAAKARAWAIIVGGIAAVIFAVMSVSVPNTSIGARLAAGLLVTVGAAGMSFVAVAMASGGADLSDETTAAVGPSTIYAYMGVGGLFNVLLGRDAAMCVAGLLLYGFAGWTYWQAGVEQAAFCLDAEVVRERRVRASDGATLLIIYALTGRALQEMTDSLGGNTAERVVITKAVLGIQIGLTVLIGIAVAIYLARRPARAGRRGLVAAVALAVAAGALGGALMRAVGAEAVGDRLMRAVGSAGAAGPAAFVVFLVVLALRTFLEEALLRGVVQRALPGRRVAAGAVGALVGVVSAEMARASFSMGGAATVALIISHICGATVYELTGRVTAAWAARVVPVVLVGVGAFA